MTMVYSLGPDKSDMMSNLTPKDFFPGDSVYYFSTSHARKMPGVVLAQHELPDHAKRNMAVYGGNWPSVNAVWCRFDHTKEGGWMPANRLFHHFKEIPYDPTQQGDLEDDI